MVFFTSRGTPKPSTHIYGVEWDWTDSGPTAGTRTDETKWNYYNALAQLLPDFYYRYQIQSVHGEFLIGDILPRTVDRNPVYSGIMLNYPIVGNGSPFFDIAKMP